MPKIKGPKDGKIITASFDSKDSSKSRFPSLKTTNDLVLLSIKGNEYCAGGFLAAIVKQAVDMHQTGPDYTGVKGKATFLIADEIYWHNLKEDSSSGDNEDALKKNAIELGDLYFKANLGAFLAPLGLTENDFDTRYPNKTVDEKIEIINKLAADTGKNFEIVRWHNWVSQNNFNEILKEIIPLYSSVEGLKVTIDKVSSEFASRHAGEGDNRELWLHRSEGYLTEESPSIMLLAAALGYNFIIYPGSILPPFEATKGYFVVDNHVARIEKGENIKNECNHNKFCIHVENPSRLVNWLEVNFKRSHENLPVKEAMTRSNISFFASRSGPKAKESLHREQGVLKNIFSANEIEEHASALALLPQNKADSSSTIRGINQVAQQDIHSGRNQANSNPSSASLTQIFAGITQGVLASDLPMAEKVGFLTELVDAYAKRPDPNYYNSQKMSIM
ncbi:hypothetical protein DGG96_17675 [Legionella qingyii]|uniref:Uncharacterized protein n=1 Tax=Legionella qingyii TaxID=2184757 RepID=A0A317TXT1_9GAMM|nr:hypothetical protein [Legionella qingyii]PWY54281.1 hypothetical protein DGG96_17675 [Legionella qingyii]RUR23585.1 hypothetical protein ELY16_13050 [Legionella qingyii]RUR24064.1 hypothetical protein ELY20_05730 [Legionella qingyii]